MLSLILLFACTTPEPVTLSEAPSSRAAYLTLTDGAPDPAHAGTWERSCNPNQPALKGTTGCVELHFFVLPVRSGTGPVQAWATCDKVKTLQACAALLAETSPLTGRVVSRVGGRDSGWQKAVAQAVQRHGLTAVPNAPVIQPKKP